MNGLGFIRPDQFEAWPRSRPGLRRHWAGRGRSCSGRQTFGPPAIPWLRKNLAHCLVKVSGAKPPQHNWTPRRLAQAELRGEALRRRASAPGNWSLVCLSKCMHDLAAPTPSCSCLLLLALGCASPGAGLSGPATGELGDRNHFANP